ncbi:MAG: hypothetical protein LBL90_06665 [Prevotellaceae bacterium]|jgi:hypothetical protein|nr:hypothetical protein [Prevotellaceae bacterium]
MYKCFKILLYGLTNSLFFTGYAVAQSEADKQLNDFVVVEKPKSAYEILADSMATLMHMAEASPNVAEKEKLSDIFRDMLIKELKKDNSFDLLFDTIPHVSTLVSADGLVRVFSWSIPARQQGVFNYFGVIQRRTTKLTSTSDVFLLEDSKDKVLLPEHDILKYPSWYGCAYYQMVEKNDGKNTYYTLIGHDFNNGISYKKCIDVLTFDKRGNPVFGAPIFLMEKKAQNRIIFEYSALSVMKVAYFEDMDKIVFNYLYPIVEEKTNDRRYYVPDTSYEGLMFKLGKWIKIPNVEMRQKE